MTGRSTPRPARRHARSRSLPRDGGAGVRPDARRHGRRRDQDRAHPHRRRQPADAHAVHQGRIRRIHDDEPQQARAGPRPQEAQGPGSPEAPRENRRRADRELSQRHDGEVRSRIRCAQGRQSRPHLLRDLGLRPHRADGEPGRLRSRDAGHVGPDVHHRRRPGPAAGQGRRAHHRHHRRAARLHRHQRRLRAQAQDRSGPARRHLPVRGRHHPDLLAVGHRLRHRRVARPARLGASPEHTLSGVRNQGRLDHARRPEPEDVGPVPQGARRPRHRQRLPFCRQRRPHGQQAGVDRRADVPLPAALDGGMAGAAGKSGRAVGAGALRAGDARTPTDQRRARWCAWSSMPPLEKCRPSGCRSNFPGRRARSRAPRRSTESMAGKFSSRPGIHAPRSTHSSPKTW